MSDASVYKQLLTVAREAISSRVERKHYSPPQLPPPLDKTQGVFVTLYSPGHVLRGCIGHIQGVKNTLAEEVSECAEAAAFHDPRFPALRPEEFGEISLEISLLGPVESVVSLRELNPSEFGVIVTSGYRRGLLLPGIEGVDSVETQIGIAKRKAGIPDGETFDLSRFRVQKIRE